MKYRQIFYTCLLFALSMSVAGCGLFTNTVPTREPVIGGQISGYVDFEIPATDAQLAEHQVGELIVKVEQKSDLDSIIENFGASVKRFFPSLDAAVLKLPDGLAITDALRKLEGNPKIIYSHPNYIYKSATIPNDIYFNNGQQWGPQKINAPAAWDLTTGNNDVVIAVLDTGVDSTHPDLVGKVLPGYNAVYGEDENNTEDIAGHGTHVAGIAAAKGNDNIGISGIAWDCPVLPVKVLKDNGGGSLADTVWGMLWVINEYLPNHPEQRVVINMSLGGAGFANLFVDAVNLVLSANVPIIVAMGNDGRTVINSPAVIQGVIAVGATDPNNKIGSFSTTGNHISIVAPGVQIYSSFPNGNYTRLNGTSMATPHVTGAVALLLSVAPSLTPSEVKSLLETTAVNPNGVGAFDSTYGYGVIDIATALSKLPNINNNYGKVVVNTVPSWGEVDVLLRRSNGEILASTRNDTNDKAIFHFVPEESDYDVRALVPNSTGGYLIYKSKMPFSVSAGEVTNVELVLVANQ